jgi:hypothetical protein
VGIGLSARAAGAIIAGRARPGRRAHRSTAGVEGPSTDAVDVVCVWQHWQFCTPPRNRPNRGAIM